MDTSFNLNTVYGLFEYTVDTYPDNPAVIEDDRTLTFKDLSGMTGDIAASFPAGIKSVGIVMHHRAEMIASMLAVLKCGARYIPAEPDFPIGRIHDMMTEAQVDLILTEPELVYKLKGFPTRLVDEELNKIKASYTDDPCGVRSGSGPFVDDEALSVKADPESPAYVLYTSGTTGRPKGVCVRNRNICHYVRAFENEFQPRPGDIMLQYSPCSFDIFVEEVYASLLNGAALAIPSQKDKDDIHSLMDFVERHGVTLISGFPYLFAEIDRLPYIPPSLRLLISGGDVLRAVYVEDLLDKAVVYNTYGPSETTVCATYYCCNTGYVLDDGTYPIGKPVKGVQIRILDEAGNEVPVGVTGEICIMGDGVSMGYIGDHEEENKAFERLPDGRIMYKSGDLGYWLPDGNIAFLHRKDDQIMIYGKRVELAEVEYRLYQCANVHQAVVRALTDEHGLSYMAAYIVPETPGIDIPAIKEELAENLASFMIPEVFVEVPAIPVNMNGKVDTAKLPVVERGGFYNGDQYTSG